MIAFYHDKTIDVLKLGCTMKNLANVCLHKPTDSNSIPSQREIKTFWKIIKKTPLVVHLSFIHAKRLFLKLLFERKFTNIFDFIVRIDASQLYHYSMGQPMLTGLYTRWDIDSQILRFIPRQNKTHSSENMVISHFQRLRSDIKMRACTIQADRRQLTASLLVGIDLIAKLCLKQGVAFTTFVPVKSCLHLSLKKLTNVAVAIETSMNWEQAIYRRKYSLSLKRGIVSSGDFTGQPLIINYLSENASLTDDRLQNTNS